MLALVLAGCSSSPAGETSPSASPTTVGAQAGQSGASGGSSTAKPAAGSGAQAGTGGAKPISPSVTTAPGPKPNTNTPVAGVGANTGDVTQTATGGVPAAGGPASAGLGGSAGAGGSEVAEVPDEACNPADKGAEPMEVAFAKPGEGPGLSTPTGEFMPIMEADPGIPTHTVIRPEPLGKFKHPIMAWGEGGCGKSGNIGMFSAMFMEFASHGILVIADGPPGNGPTMAGQDAGPLLFGLEWAIKENERPCSQYYHKLDVTKLAVSGQSCGGLMAIQAATDPRITTAFPYNSGLFARDQSIYDKLHAPMAIFDGGPDDIAYANGLADFNAIDKIPILFANPSSCSSNAHVCTFFDEHAGEFGRAGVGWLRWHLLNDQGPTGKGMFIGDGCGICGSEWDIMWKNAPM
jgi:hypothetical protein